MSFPWKTWLILSLTLGLAPFTPEPNIAGKVQWLFRGAKGMELMDWFDLCYTVSLGYD